MRLETVAVGVDFSPSALAALRWVASDLAPAAELVLVHAVELPPRPGFLRGHAADPSTTEREARARGADRLHDLAILLGLSRACEVVRAGPPADVLRDAAHAARADLVVVGAHGERSRQSRLLGTTADRLVRTCEVPVLVCVAPPSAPPRTIIAAVDDSPMVACVLAAADELARRFGADLMLLHVLSNAVVSTALSVAAATAASDEEAAEQVGAELREETQRWLGQLAPSSRGAGVAGAMVAHGTAAEEILAAARRSHAELIVVGRHGAGRVLPPLLGRTVRTVLHESPCSVLVVTPERAGGGV